MAFHASRKKTGGVPRAIHDQLDASVKERVVDKRKIRAMSHEAGGRYFDLTPVMIVALGMDDRLLYVMAGVGAALFLAVRMLLMRGSAK